MARISLPPPLTWGILGHTVESLQVGSPKGEVVLVFESGDRLTIGRG